MVTNKTTRLVLTAGVLILSMSTARAQSSSHAFAVHADGIGASIALDGGGRYDALSGFLQGGGGFRVTSDIVTGPLAGLRAGDAGHWEAFTLLPSSGFKCSGLATEQAKTATTDDDTVVLTARFIPAGGASPLTAKLFVSAQDEDPIAPGSQNVWIQGVGCDEANVNVR